MPKRKAKKVSLSKRTSSAEAQVNFTFFNSKLFVSLVAVALIVIAFAVISAMNNNTPEVSRDSYRIDTTNLKNDPSANQFVSP